MSVRSRLLLDLFLFIGFLVAFSPEATGSSVHEWLSLALIFPLLFHIVINWNWVLSVASRILRRARAASRLNLVVDTLLFVATVTVMMSGLLISRTILAATGISGSPDAVWRTVHSWSADASIALLFVHLSLHAPWIARVVRGGPRQPVRVRP